MGFEDQTIKVEILLLLFTGSVTMNKSGSAWSLGFLTCTKRIIIPTSKIVVRITYSDLEPVVVAQ